MAYIGVVIATYNGELYIREQLESILNQSSQVSNIFIVDDNSSDLTLAIVNNVLKYSNIDYEIIEHKENKGVLASFWEGINRIGSDIIFLSDQDDVWLPNKVEIFLDYFKKYPEKSVCFSDSYITDANLAIKPKSLWENIDYKPGRKSLVEEMCRRNVFTGMSMAFRKGIISYNPLISFDMLHDCNIGWTATIYDKAVYINEKTALYRQHGSNAVGIERKRRKVSLREIKDMIIQSSHKTAAKFELIKIKAEGTNNYQLVNNAFLFNKERLDLERTLKIKGLFKCLKWKVRGMYHKYTGAREFAFLKDVFCCLMPSYTRRSVR